MIFFGLDKTVDNSFGLLATMLSRRSLSIQKDYILYSKAFVLNAIAGKGCAFAYGIIIPLTDDHFDSFEAELNYT